jgi:glyoxylase-like metal-dependent hydrolase (beta-lactamase superfamily II)
MKIGSFTVELLSEGQFEIFKDGHINRNQEVEDTSSDIGKSVSGQSITVGINPVLIQTGTHNILLDTGLGWGLDAGSKFTDVSNVLTNLAIFQLDPDDITHVFLSHLHYDHAAGSSFTNTDMQVQPTFPNASYFVHQQEWEYALGQIDVKQHQFGANYQLDDFYRLVGNRRVHFVTGNRNEIADGITLLKTGGHTPGHQIVKIESEGEQAYYLGDLLPNSSHLNHYAMGGADANAVQAKKEKVQLLKKVHREQAILLFYHSKHEQAGRLIRDKNKQYVLADLPRE